MIRILLFVLFCSLQIWSYGQKDTNAYVYTFGGGQDEQTRDLERTNDEGYVMVGATSSFGNGNSDIYLVKVDSNIKFEWSKAIGNYNLDFGQAVKQTTDGGFVICGYSNSGGNGTYDGYLVRTNDTGAVLWEKYFGGFDWDKFYDVEVTPDGGFLLIGETHSFGAGDSDAWLIKTDSTGNKEWEKFIGGKRKDLGNDLIKTRDGNFAFCGENASKNDSTKADVWLVKFNAKGEILIDVTKPLLNDDLANGLIETLDSGFVLIGNTNSFFHDEYDLYMCKFDSTGRFLWGDIYGIIQPNSPDYGQALDLYPNGNMLFVGSSVIGNSGFSFYTGMVSPTGRYLTAPSYGGEMNDHGYDCMINPKGGEIFAGTFTSRTTGYSDQAIITVDTVDGNKPLVFNNYKDLLPAPLKSSTTLLESKLISYPNPFKTNLNLEFPADLSMLNIRITSIQGQIVYDNTFYNIKSESLDLSDLNTGLYTIHFRSSNQSWTKKIMKIN